MLNRYTQALLAVLVFFCSFGFQAKAQSSNFDMKTELKRLAQLDSFPANAGFYNTQGVEYFKRQIPYAPTDFKRYTLIYEMCWQYIYAGYPDSALVYMDEIPDEAWENARKTNPAYDKFMMSGLCHLRIGEQANCQNNHNAFSCILPLNDQAQHKDRSGSEKAIEFYQKALERSPNYYTARWLMNIAYMTLGKYPDEVPKEYFIDFKHFQQDESTPYFKNIADELGVATLGYYGGSIVEDFNNDGFLDLFTTSGDLETNCELYINNGKNGYDRMTEKANLTGITGGGNLTHADYNNDGFVDIYIIRGGWLGKHAGKYHPNSLLKNNGDGTFTDVTYDVGILGYFPSQAASWADFNNDGWLDLFVGNENGYSKLYQNEKGTFKDISGICGVFTQDFVKASYWGDYNNDGLQDLFVSVCGAENHLYKNNGPDANGQYTFIDVAQAAGVANPIWSFSTFFFDFNNDGFLDLFCSSYPSDVHSLAQQYVEDTANVQFSGFYLNNGDGTFTDIAKEVNLHRSIEAMGLNFGDIDNDGFLDFYVGTGYPQFDALMPNLLFKNVEGKHFLEVGDAGFGHLQKGHGIGFGDLDNDGDQDIYMNLGGFMEADKFWNVLLENPGNDNNWITLKLEGVKSNRSAIGAEITIAASGSSGQRKIYRVVSPGGSFGSSSLQQEIGLGDCDAIDWIEINWPKSGIVQKFKNVEINKVYQVKEGQKKLSEVKTIPIKLAGSQNNHHHHHH